MVAPILTELHLWQLANVRPFGTPHLGPRRPPHEVSWSEDSALIHVGKRVEQNGVGRVETESLRRVLLGKKNPLR